MTWLSNGLPGFGRPLPDWRKAWYSSASFRWQREWKRRCSVALHAGLEGAAQAGSMRVTLCRIIGNDLFPRHRRGQALANLHVILQKEGSHDGWRKLFILNRIVDQNDVAEAMEAIDRAGHACKVIPFDSEAYRATRYRPDALGGLAYFESPSFAAQDDFCQDRLRLWACAEKIRYLMNVNGARNLAIACGRENSDWTLVLDGSCLVPDRAFAKLHADISSAPFVPYLIIPMRRTSEDVDLDAVKLTPHDQEEPQIAFRSDAAESFDESYPYGLRDKTSLLKRLGVPGAWWAWAPLAWKPEISRRSPERNLYKYASVSVLRLTSGVAQGSLELKTSQKLRYQARITAIFATLQSIDRHCMAVDATLLQRIAGCSAKRVDGVSWSCST